MSHQIKNDNFSYIYLFAQCKFYHEREVPPSICKIKELTQRKANLHVLFNLNKECKK